MLQPFLIHKELTSLHWLKCISEVAWLTTKVHLKTICPAGYSLTSSKHNRYYCNTKTQLAIQTRQILSKWLGWVGGPIRIIYTESCLVIYVSFSIYFITLYNVLKNHACYSTYMSGDEARERANFCEETNLQKKTNNHHPGNSSRITDSKDTSSFTSSNNMNCKLFIITTEKGKRNAICPVDWGEISMKQSVGKCKPINF